MSFHLQISNRRTEWMEPDGFCVEWAAGSNVYHAYVWVMSRGGKLVRHLGIAGDVWACLRLVKP